MVFLKQLTVFLIRNGISIPNIEIVWVDFHCDNNKFLTGVMYRCTYRPPNSRVDVLNN